MLLPSILFFLLLSALFSGTEIAFISASKLRIELMKKKGGQRGRILARFYDKPSQFLSTMLVGNNIALVVFTALMTRLLEPYIIQVFQINSSLFILFTNTVLITIVVLIFGEFLPKTLFRLHSDDIIYFLTYPLKGLQILLAIPAYIMTKLSDWILRLFFKQGFDDSEQVFTRLDLENFIVSSETNKEEDINKEMFGKALNLKEVKVRDCMIPRPEIESIDVSASIDDLEQMFKDTKLSRIIVIKDDIDEVVGYVHHHQLFNDAQDIESLIMDIPFTPEVMRVTDLMNQFIKENTSIACVVNEFGGISGVITLEDILEEIFGEIEDEHDQEEHLESQISENEFLFSGRLEVDFLNEKYQLDFPKGEYHTLSGYLVMTTEKIPEEGAEITMDGYRFILEEVSDTKIDTVRVLKLEERKE